ELRINNWGINKALFTRDGRRVITAGDDGAIRVWDAATGDHLYGILAHSGWVLDIDISPDGRYLASGGDDKQIRIWDLHTGRHVRTLAAHHNWVHDVEYHPGGSSLLSASKDSTFRLWDPTTGRLIHTNRAHRDQVYSATYSPPGDKILTCSKDGTVRMWDDAGKKQFASLEAKQGQWFHSAHFGTDANRVITASSQRKVRVWVVHERKPFQHDVSDQAFQIVSPDPRFEPFHFGSHYVGHSRDTLLKGFFENPSEHPLKVEQVYLSGEDRSDFTLVSGFQEFVMPPKSRRNLEMIFRAGSVGKKKAEMIAVTPTDSLSIPIRGRGLLQRYDIPYDHLHMGRLNPGEKRDSTIVLVRNRGNTSLHIADLKLEGAGREAFMLQEGAEDPIVYPNGKKRMHVVFAPHETGRNSARLSFRVNQSRHSIDLMGEGIGPSHVVLTGQVFSRKDEKALSAGVNYFDLKTNRHLGESEIQSRDFYRLKMLPGRKYRVVAEAQGYIPGSIPVDLSSPDPVDTLRRNIYLAPIQEGSEVTLNNIFFEYARARLTETSRGELGQISRFLKENDTLHVEIAGHTDSIGTEEANRQLSRDRAEAVRAFLVESGIDPGRIQAKGYGESKPVADNSTEEGRQKNRRVVFTIIRSGDSGLGS
ncbi:MAG TPA: OmpA family protein, partial [Bacteroidales bacterium]|nr:OmpA family protein [Bacteroidales bacterium]